MMTRSAGSRGQKVALGGAGVSMAVLLVSAPIIDRYEGTILATYRDPVGILTSCKGHTGPELRLGQTFTIMDCKVQFDRDQRRILAGMADCTEGTAPIETWSAFLSFSFNVGYGTFCKNFAPMINSGDLAGACARMSLYIYAKRQMLNGLVNRRATERALCESAL